MSRRGGFTLIELMSVVSIIGILSAIAIPNLQIYQAQAKATEALINLEVIGYLEQVRILELGEPIACAPQPEKIPKAEKLVFNPSGGWADIGYRADARVFYQYEVRTSTDGHYKVEARGDLDGDNEISRFIWDSRTMAISREKPAE